MREEILAGLKNAMERGSSLEQATQSFINAGYNEREVRSAAQSFTQGTALEISKDSQPVSHQIQSQAQEKSPEPPKQQPIQDVQPQQVQQFQQTPQTQTPQTPSQTPSAQIEKPKKSRKGLVIALSAILGLLILILLATIFFKNQIIRLFA